ncbi:MAG: YggT family protein [Patescibacteria group bacterium]
MDFVLQTLNILADLLLLLLFIRVIFSWFNVRSGAIVKFIYELTETFLAPIRRLLPSTGFLDLSPLIAFFIIELLRGLINQIPV